MTQWNSEEYPPVPTDGQRRREYRAEWALCAEFDFPKMLDRQVRSFLRDIENDQWFIDRFGTVSYDCKFNKRRTRRACCRRNYGDDKPRFTLHFPGRGGNSAFLALHEFAHVVCYTQKHGPVFVAVLLQLMTRYFGGKVGNAFRKKLAIHGCYRIR
jgi:hypothetical protein